MDIALLLARLVLTAVFIVSGVAKLADLPGSRKATAGFGVPSRFVPAGAVMLPIAELLVAIVLIFTATAFWGALGALVLLILFIGVVGINLARGRTPDCHCFGQLHSTPIGWSTIARNLVLGALAGFILAGGRDKAGASAFSWLTELSGRDVVFLIGALVFVGVVVISGWVVINLMEQNGRLLTRLEAIEQSLTTGAPLAVVPAVEPTPAARLGLEVGTVAPAFALPDLTGAVTSLKSLRSAVAPTLLLFTDPGCGPCNRMMPEVGRWQRELSKQLNVVVVSRGTQEANLAKSSEHGITQILLQDQREVAQAYGAHRTPAAIIVLSDGTIGTPLAGGVEAIRALVATTTAFRSASSLSPSAPQQPSTPSLLAPAFSLPDLDGKVMSLTDIRTATLPVVLFFTDSRCDPCDVLLPDIGRWQEEYRERMTTALISNGTVDANRKKTQPFGIKNVLLQQEHGVVNAYDIAQAPAAIIVQPNGHWDGQAAYGDFQIRRLIERVAGGSTIPPQTPRTGSMSAPSSERSLQIGDALPSLQLPTLESEMLNLQELHGTNSVLLFWSPTCGYCHRMVGDLRAWEGNRTDGSPKLIVVSTGSDEATRADGFRSTVALDHGQGVGRQFGAHGTPAAVRIDKSGHIDSPVASGVSAVLALLQSELPSSSNGHSSRAVDLLEM